MLVLLVDDEEAIVNLLRSLLKENGFEVLSAHNGQEALERFKQVQIDLVISDIYMPGMDGIKLHEALRARPEYAKLPFLFISGYDDAYTAGAVRDSRYDGFWRKTGDVSDLIRWVQYFSQPENKRSRIRPDGVLIPPFVEQRPDVEKLNPKAGKGAKPS